MEHLTLHERYLTKSSNCVSRTLPSSRISFATGTRFNNKFDKHHSDLIKRSIYNIKPIKERESLMRYRAPAATIPVGPYQSVTKMDYTYPSEHLLRAMNPQPKWIYRSRSDLGAGRILDHDYQYFSSGRTSKATGENNEVRNETGMSNAGNDSEMSSPHEDKSLIIKENEIASEHPENRVERKEFPNHSDHEDNYYAFYKPLVGDSRERYIESAYIKRAAEGVIIPMQIDKRNIDFEKRPFVPRQIRFTDTFNKVFEPKAENFTKVQTKLPIINKNALSYDFKPSQTLQGNQARVSLYQKMPQAQSLNTDMIRTYEKQAKLREMIQK